MGICASSSDVAENEMLKSKGGSVILQRKVHGAEAVLEVGKGDSIIIGPNSLDEWCPGQPIVRPAPLARSRPVEIDCGDRILVLTIGYQTLQGKNPQPPHKPNQDSLIMHTEIGGRKDLGLLAVFDGHGPYGEHASHYCRTQIAKAIETRPEFADDPVQAFERCFPAMHEGFVTSKTRESGVDPMVSGTTCTSIMIHGATLHTANVGDSRAVLATVENGQLTAVPLSDDHKPQRPDEIQRLQQSSAILLTEREVRGFGDENKVYVCREREGVVVYGILFTRSIGDEDAHDHLGIVSEPEMSRREVQPGDRFVVLATDGIWDHMSNQEVVDFVSRVGDPLAACNALVETAKDLWDTEDLDRRRDDITVVVAKFSWKAKADEAGAAAEAATGAAAEGERKEEDGLLDGEEGTRV